MNRMRQDAIRRSREMHRGTAGSLPPFGNVKADRPHEHNNYSGKNAIGHGKGGLNSLIDDILGGGIDDDKLLIAALLYMLIKEGADIKLIIALGYILL